MYSKIDSMFWKDAKNKTLSDDERIMFLYILTCPHKNILGLFVLPLAYIEADLKWNNRENRVSDRVSDTLSSLCNKGYILYDKDTEVILIKNYLKYNSLESSKQMIGAIKILSDIPITKLENTLISILSTFKNKEKSNDFNNGIDTLCSTLSDRVCHTSNSNSNYISNSISTTTIYSIDNINNIEEQKKNEDSVVVFENDLVLDFYKKNIDEVSDYSRMFIKLYRNKKISDDLIIYAMKIAVEQKKKTIAYVKGILDKWEKADITSILEAQQAIEEHKKQQSSDKPKTKPTQCNYEQRNYTSEEIENVYANKQKHNVKTKEEAKDERSSKDVYYN